jgi:hypothetical protein
MKKFLLIIVYIICTIGFCNTSFSQRNKANCIGVEVKQLSMRSPSDTIRPASFATGRDTLYKFIDGGYSFGTNHESDRAFAQVYRVTKSYSVYGIALWIGAKQQVGIADTLNVNMYKLDGPGTDTSEGPISNAPDTVTKHLKIPVNLIDTTGLTFITFPDSFIVYSDYAVGIDLKQMNDDTIGLVTTRDGDAHKSQLSWNKWSDGTWHTILEPLNWNMDLDLGIFVIVDLSTANINDNYFVDGIKLSQNRPNPSSGSTLVQYALRDDANNVSLEVYDASGKRILNYNEGKQSAGKHDIQIDLKNINNGVYYYSLKAGSHRLTKKMIVTE